MKIGNRITLQTLDGTPVQVGSFTVRPQAQAFQVRLPFGNITYNRPVSILVDNGESVQRVPIVDATRVAQLTFYALALLTGVAFWQRSRNAGP